MDRSPFQPEGGERNLLVFRPRSARRGLFGALCLVAGFLSLLGTFGGQSASPSPLKAGLYGVALLGLGVWLITCFIRGAPKLILDDNGLTQTGALGRKVVRWCDVGPLTLVTFRAGWRSRLRIIAPIPARIRIPGMAQPSLSIPDVYRTPLAEIMAELQKRQATTAGFGMSARQEPSATFQPGGPRRPWLTIALVMVIAAVFIAEQVMAVAPATRAMTPALSTLVALGGQSLDLAAEGQWWRLLTASFLHANLAHLLGNGAVLFFAGYLLERNAGSAWMLCVFFLGAIAGAAGSLVLNASSTVTVGASGAIIAMVAALFVVSLHLPGGTAKARMQMLTLRVAILSLIPFSQTIGSSHIDYGAHGGGALMGIILGFVMLAAWGDGAALPRYRTLAAALATAGLIACLWGASEAATAYPAYAGLGPLIPKGDVPNQAEAIDRGPELLQRFPGDPRSSYFAGLAAARQGDGAAAAHLLRQAITMADAQTWRVPPNLANEFRATFAEMLLDEGRRDEAVAFVRQVCAATGPRAIEPSMMSALRRTSLCDAAP